MGEIHLAEPDVAIGIIGMGDMGKMYARRLAAAGWRYGPHNLSTEREERERGEGEREG
jgi:prephenate dehydrogenase (NADP+)